MSDPNLPPGARLKAEREQRGMSIEKAAKDMHLDTSVIEALEAGDYQRLGPMVYAKGHLKRYATMLGLPVHEILAAFEPVQSAAPEPERSNYPVGSKHTREPSRVVSPAQAAASLAAAVALIAVVVWQPWRQQERAAAPKSASVASSAAELPGPASDADSDAFDATPALAADNEALRALAGGGSGGGVATPGAASSRVPARSLAAPNAKTTAAKANEQKAPQAKSVMAKAVDAAKPGAARAADAKAPDAKTTVATAIAAPQRAHLRLSFTSDSWVDVRDALGNRAFVGNGSANTVKTIAGAAPLHVYLRSASGVQLEINGRAVAIGPQFFSGDVARFEAGADGVLRREQTSARPPG
jgi:cytoskeleton protein RodZ